MDPTTENKNIMTTENKNNWPTATPLGSLQEAPAAVDCPACNNREMTTCAFVNGGRTHGAAVLCCLCFCLGCIPYMTNWFKDVEHKCGNCGIPLALFHKSGKTEVLAHRTG